MKNISLFTTNMVYIYFHTQYKIMLMAGWLITKLFEGLHTEICKFKEKHFSFHLASRQCFPHNFVNIQQIWLVDGLNCLYRTHACYEQQEAHILNIFTDLNPLLLPLPPKFQSYIESHKQHLLIEIRQRVYVNEFQLPCLTKISKFLSKFIYFATHRSF